MSTCPATRSSTRRITRAAARRSPSRTRRASGCIAPDPRGTGGADLVLLAEQLELRRRGVTTDHDVHDRRRADVDGAALGRAVLVRAAVVELRRRRAADLHVEVRVAGAGDREGVLPGRDVARVEPLLLVLRHGAALLDAGPRRASTAAAPAARLVGVVLLARDHDDLRLVDAGEDLLVRHRRFGLHQAAEQRERAG